MTKLGFYGLALAFLVCGCGSSRAGSAAGDGITVIAENDFPRRYVLRIDGQPVGEIEPSRQTTLEVPRVQFVSRRVPVCVHPVGATRQLLCRTEGPLFISASVQEMRLSIRSVTGTPRLTVSVSPGGRP